MKKKILISVIAAALTAAIATGSLVYASQETETKENTDTAETTPEITTSVIYEASPEEIAEIEAKQTTPEKIPEYTTSDGIDGPEEEISPANTDYNKTITLKGFGSTTVSFDMSGQWGAPNHGVVTFSISQVTGEKKDYSVSLYNRTDEMYLFNGEIRSGDYNFTLGPINRANDWWDFSIANPNGTPITFNLTIKSRAGS